MGWPQAVEYNNAIQNPDHCFRDDDLKQGQPAMNLFGLPLSWSGSFATVYKIVCPDKSNWAVKCFTREVKDLQDRYHQISKHLEENPRRFAVEFHYLPQGILVRDQWYPALKMRWVEGFTLNEFL